MFVWTSVDSELDGGFTAGLIAGDGHFGILPNNGGTSWQCVLAVRLRADDTPLLASLCRWSGVGSLAAVPARATSRPQTCWTVQRQADCLRVVSILDRYPLRGKKRGEYEIWRTAIAAWTGRRDDRYSVVADCHERLRAYRDATNVAPASRVSITEHELLTFLAGFVTAEAHFGATPEGHPFFVINLRNDDRELLRLFCSRLGLGQLADVPPYRTSRAARSWRISRLDELRAFTRHLDRYPPRGRVLRIYEAWRELVLLRERRSGARRLLAVRVKQRRAYKPGLERIERIDAPAARRSRHVQILKAWAAAIDGPCTATSYEAWRRDSRPEAPTCDTVASAFGSWVSALEAAGLSTEGCRSTAANTSARARAAAARPARLAQHRATILAAVRKCEQMLGRHPRATEFFAWRSRFAPETPCHTTIYRAFPGGWASVLAALEADADSAAREPLQSPAEPLDVAPPAGEQLAWVPDVQPGAADQLGHEGVAGDEVAAWQGE
jgi:LAGLIDADG DNA endonuclease family protein